MRDTPAGARRRPWGDVPGSLAVNSSWALWGLACGAAWAVANAPAWIWFVLAAWLAANVAAAAAAWRARFAPLERRPRSKAEAVERGTSLTRDALGRLRKNQMATLSLVLLAVLVAACAAQRIAFAAPYWAGLDPGAFADDSFYALHVDHTRQHEGRTFEPPSRRHWFGTDALGRDLFARTLYGGGVSFLVGFVGTVVSVVVGVAWGSIAGYFGGRLDDAMMRIVDVLYGLPFLFLVILIMALVNGLGNVANAARQTDAEIRQLEKEGRADEARKLRGEIPPEARTAVLVTDHLNPIVVVFVAVGLVSWLTMARITRGQMLSLKEREFVVAARSIGADNLRIIFRHIVPNLLGPIVVYATLTIPEIMLAEAFLSFVGLGISEPNCSWGSLASDGLPGVNVIKPYWWLMTYPAAALSLSLFCLNFVGDGLRDALDPRSAR